MALSTHKRIRAAVEAKQRAIAEPEYVKPEITANVEDINKMNLSELRRFAGQYGINVTGIKRTDDVRARVLEALPQASESISPTAGAADNADETNSGAD